MNLSGNWDWQTGKRIIAEFDSWKEKFPQVDEPYASPDGEIIAAAVRTEDDSMNVCANGEIWENGFDRIWYPRFAPDNRLTCLVSESGEWTVAVDGEPWEERFEFVWNTQFGADGKTIVASAVHSEKRYVALCNGVSWENGFLFMTQVTAGPGQDVAGS
ncbi:WD40-like beta Propeller containing protein (fragment) [Syntrophobacter sp. SbD1]